MQMKVLHVDFMPAPQRLTAITQHMSETNELRALGYTDQQIRDIQRQLEAMAQANACDFYDLWAAVFPHLKRCTPQQSTAVLTALRRGISIKALRLGDMVQKLLTVEKKATT